MSHFRVRRLAAGLLSLAVLCLCAAPVLADGTNNVDAASLGLKAASTINGRLMTNPPLPLLRLRKGDYKLTFMPAWMTGSLTGGIKGEQDSTAGGKYNGWGGAMNASYAFADRWGVFGMFMGNHIWGSFTDHLADGSFRDNTGSNTSYYTGAFGVEYQFFGDKPDGFTMPVFIGPAVTRLHTRTRVSEFGFNSPASNDDFDLSVDHTMFGIFAGLQMGIPVGKAVELNPFLILSPMGPESPKNPTISNVRIDNGNPNNALELLQAGNPMTNSTPGIGFGMNVIYRPWGLAANVTAPFMTNYSLLQNGVAKNVRSTILSVSWSFGKYQK